MNVYDSIKQNLIKNNLIPDEILLKYIKKRIDEEDLEEHINCVVISAECESGYNMDNKLLSINPNEILYDVMDKKIPNVINIISKNEKETCIIKDPNKVNIYNIQMINHELSHAKQEKIAYDTPIIIDEDNKFNVYRLLLLQKTLEMSYFDEIYFNDYYYNKYHDYFYLEYDANINGYLEALSLINSCNIDDMKSIIILFNKLVAQNLLYLYHDIENRKQISSPSKNSLKLRKIIIESLKEGNIEFSLGDFSIYKGIDAPKDQIDRLRLGLPINYKVLKHLYNISKGNEKRLNLFNDIRNI